MFVFQAVTNINTLLDKADRVYHQLMGHRPQLESLLSKVNEAAPEKPQVSHKRNLNTAFKVKLHVERNVWMHVGREKNLLCAHMEYYQVILSIFQS